MSDVKKYELKIMELYTLGMERIDIIQNLAIDYGLSYTEAEPIVSATILRHTGGPGKK